MDRFGAILRAACDGDDQAWAEILYHYQAMMRLALDRAGISPELRQRLDPEDVMQQALIRAHRELPRAMPLDQEAFTAWLLRVTLRSLEDRVRFHYRERRTPRAEARGLTNYVPADRGERPDDAASRVETWLQLLAAVSTLPRQDQRMVLWKVVEGHSHEAIASALGTTTMQVRGRLQRALAKLVAAFPDR